MPASDAQVETAPTAATSPIRRAACERGRNELVGTVRQRRIGMKEDEYFAAAERSPDLECRAAVARTGDDAIGERMRQRRGVVAAAAIDNNHFGAAGPQRRKRLQRRRDDRRFIEYGNNDSEPPHIAKHVGNIAGKAAVGQPCLRK